LTFIKDRLYTFAPRNQARRSAQTALYRIADALARMLATILVFTGDEIWENLPQREDAVRLPSVHVAKLAGAKGQRECVSCCRLGAIVRSLPR